MSAASKKQARESTDTAQAPATGAEPNDVCMVLDEQQVMKLFVRGTANETCVAELGYDIRLGIRVTRITKGTTVDVDEKTGVKIFPGETILAESLEVLDLPANVCATGSPKMRLLLQGLWSHGGKTDFGYNSSLLLGFINHGTEPITLHKGQKIFNIIFWRVSGRTKERRGKSVPQPTHTKPSPLEQLHRPTPKFRREVLHRDGIVAYRVINLLHLQQRRTRLGFALLGGGILLMAGFGALSLWQPALSTVSASAQILTLLVSGLGASIAFLRKTGGDENIESME